MDDCELQQTIFLHISRRQRLGPFFCSEYREVADHLPQLLTIKLHETIDVENSIFVVVYSSVDEIPVQFRTDLSRCLTDLSAVNIFQIRLEKGESVLLEDVENRLLASYGRDKIDNVFSLTVWTAERGEHESYSSGSIFTAKTCVFRSLTTSTSTSDKDDRMITPLANQPLVNPTQESLSGSGSFKCDLPNLSQREGELHGSTLSLEHKVSSVEIVENEGALFKPHKLDVEDAVVHSDKSEENIACKDVLKVDALELDGTDETVLLHAKPRNESSGPSLSHDDKQEGSNNEKLSSSSSLVLPPLQKLNTNAGFVVSTGLKTTDVAKDVEDYAHDERFVLAREQREDKERKEGEEITETTKIVRADQSEEREDIESESAHTHPQCYEEIGTIQKHMVCITKSQEFRHCQPQSEGDHCHLVAPQWMNPRPNELLGDSRAELVYLPPNAARRRNSNVPSTNSDLQNKKDEDSPPVTNVSLQKERFPPVDKLKFVQDRAFIYVVEEFKQDTHLSNHEVCRNILPPPEAVQDLNPDRILQFAAHMNYFRSTFPKICGDYQQLPQSAFLGSGGNGITFELELKGKKYAVKWMRYMPEVLHMWSKLDHPNIVSLLAVANVAPGCYIFMPRMTGNLGALMAEVGDLYEMAKNVDVHEWKNVVEPNIQHLLASILRGVASLHKEGYQHRDLKEWNILYRKRCPCPNFFLCQCSFENKCIITIADFDSLESVTHHQLQQRTPDQLPLKVGTIYYRPRDAYMYKNTPYWDIWSFGVLVCSVCHDQSERAKIMKTSKFYVHPRPSSRQNDYYVLSVAETSYGREMLRSLTKKCIVKRVQLEPLMNIAELCLMHEEDKRLTAQQLLEGVDFLRRI